MNDDSLLNLVIGALVTGTAEIVKSEKGDHVKLDCPQCGKDRHFNVRIVSGWYRCYRCGYGGKLEFGQRVGEWLAAVRRVSRGGPSSARSVSPRHENTGDGYRNLLRVPASSVDAPELAVSYLRKRGVDRETMRRYKIEVEKWGHRVWFPYWDDKGTLVFEMGRTIVANLEPKTIEPMQTDKPLYGLHVGLPFSQDVFAVEGVFDHFQTPCSLAMMGSDLYASQVEQFRQLKRRVFFLLDPDAPAKAMRLASRLRMVGMQASALLLQGTKSDPADLGESTMLSVVSSIRRMQRVPQTLHVFVSSQSSE